MILEELWRDEPCRRGMVSLATGAAGGSGSEAGVAASAAAAAFRDYISCTLNSLMYLFKVKACHFNSTTTMGCRVS